MYEVTGTVKPQNHVLLDDLNRILKLRLVNKMFSRPSLVCFIFIKVHHRFDSFTQESNSV